MRFNIAFIRCALALAALLPARFLRASDDSVKVDVVVNLTDEGRKVAAPTPERPAYFLPMPGGYKDYGTDTQFGPKRRPPQPEIENALYRALAQQGYQIMTHENHPTLVLSFTWGYMAPPPPDSQALSSGSTVQGSNSAGGMSGGIQMAYGGAQAALMNNMYPRMLDLVAGNTFGSETNPIDPRLDEVRMMVQYPRYYIYVSAFDFDSWLKNYRETRSGQKNPEPPTLLWSARMSCELWGHYFDQVAQTLITSGAPWFGRETKRPEVATTPLVPLGRVIVGAPVVKEFQAKPAADKQP